MRLVERHIVKDNRFEDICFKSGLLYNYVLYNIRQGIFSGNYLPACYIIMFFTTFVKESFQVTI